MCRLINNVYTQCTNASNTYGLNGLQPSQNLLLKKPTKVYNKLDKNQSEHLEKFEIFWHSENMNWVLKYFFPQQYTLEGFINRFIYSINI